MKLYCWRGAVRNFGDELNTLLWPRLLPDFFDGDAAVLFLGIGSVLDARHPGDVVKVVAGAGYGGYEPAPKLDGNWVIHWVRGPHTARRVGLPSATGLGDPAMLLPAAGWARDGGSAVGFMPHFESLENGAWREAAALAGVELIDPRGNPAAVLSAIRHCRLLLSEAMHGVIVADTLRVPWVALRPLASIHPAKWQDWADTLGIEVRFQPMAASTVTEWLHAKRIAGRRRAAWPLEGLTRVCLTEHAARLLSVAAARPPQLSPASALERCQTQMLERLNGLRQDPLHPPQWHD